LLLYVFMDISLPQTLTKRSRTQSCKQVLTIFGVLILVGFLSCYSHAAQNSCSLLFSSSRENSITITRSDIEQGFSSLTNSTRYYGLKKEPGTVLQIERASSWGNSESFAGKGIEVSFPVVDRNHGNKILTMLLDSVGVKHSELTQNSMKEGADLSHGIYAYFESPRERAGGIEPSMRLILTNNQSQSLHGGELIIRSLMNQGIFRMKQAEITYDLTNNTGRHEWALNSFRANRKLTDEEVKALYDLAGSHYKDINRSLRTPGRPQDHRVELIDSAIDKGRVDRTIKVYRAVERKDLLEMWNNLINNRTVDSRIAEDPAYLFSSLDPKVATWWQKYDNKRSNGIILEIEIPAGSKAAYIDSRIIERRGYLEVVLPRNTKMVAQGASTHDGFKILKVQLQTQ
jgi:hypothetical protein